MAQRTARLRVEIDAQNKAAGELKDLSGDVRGVGDAFKGMAAAAAGAAIVGFLSQAAEAASRLQQSTGGVEAVFKSSAGAIKSWASEAASSIGLSQSSYQELATVIGSQLKNAGVAMSELAPRTNDLIQQGADLAAMFGGTTADAVGALSSALKGERDPIEKYGISITDAGVKAEIAAQGLDTSTSAAEANAKAVATMALITKQGGDAWGAAAREQDTYAASQQRLAATWENVMAAIGGPLLGVLADLGDTLADAALAVAPLLTAVTSLIGWLLDLPAPILAAVAALTAWKFLGGPITTMLGNFTAAAGGAGNAAYAFGQKLGSALKMIGAGGAIAVAAFAIMSIVNAYKDAEAATEAWNNSVIELGSALKDVDSTAVDGLVQSAIKGQESFKAVVAASGDYALAMKGVTDGASLTTAEHDKLVATLQDMDPALALQYTRLQNLKGEALANAESQRQLDVANRAAADGISEASAAAAISAEEQAKLDEEQRKVAISAAQVTAEQTAVSGVLNSVSSASGQASRALQFFTAMMDEAAGRTPTVEASTARLNDSLRGTAAAFEGATQAGGFSHDALLAWDVGALTSTEAGGKLYDSLTQVRGAYDSSVTAAYSAAAATGDMAKAETDARAAADAAYSSFMTMAQAQGYTAEQAAMLAAELGIVQGVNIDPKIFDVLAKDAQAQQSLTGLQSLVIPPKDVLVEATVAPAETSIGAIAGQAWKTVIGTSAEVQKARGDITAVEKANYQATIKADAQVQQASSQIDTVAARAYRATIQVDANVSPALQSIGNVTNGRFNATVNVGANTTAATNSINAVTSGYYTATIQVVANTSGALASIAAIPRSVNVAATPAPAPAAMMAAPQAMSFGLMAAATPAPAVAPSVRYPHGTGRAGGGDENNTAGTTTINITVSGAEDPDRTARRINRVLTERARRAGGVRI